MSTTLVIVVNIILFFALLRWAFFVAVVEGNSMIPTFVEGQRVLVFRLWPKTRLRKGQVVITRIEKKSWLIQSGIKVAIDGVYIKRIVGLSGDEIISSIKDLPDIYRFKLAEFFDQDGRRVWKIPPDHYFIKSDYRGLDSTLAGPISSKNFIGVVLGKLPSEIIMGRTNE